MTILNQASLSPLDSIFRVIQNVYTCFSSWKTISEMFHLSSFSRIPRFHAEYFVNRRRLVIDKKRQYFVLDVDLIYKYNNEKKLVATTLEIDSLDSLTSVTYLDYDNYNDYENPSLFGEDRALKLVTERHYRIITNISIDWAALNRFEFKLKANLLLDS